jgi:hypothetical protein
VLRSVLEAVGAFDVTHAVRKSDLRTLLAHLSGNNPLFKKATSGPTGLISAVVQEALQKGLIKLESEMDRTNPYIWLAAADRRSGAAVSAAGGMPNGPRRSRSQEFLDILKDQNLGPFAKLRPMLYEAMQHALVRSSLRLLLYLFDYNGKSGIM